MLGFELNAAVPFGGDGVGIVRDDENPRMVVGAFAERDGRFLPGIDAVGAVSGNRAVGVLDDDVDVAVECHVSNFAAVGDGPGEEADGAFRIVFRIV